jgi:hypothetical protein
VGCPLFCPTFARRGLPRGRLQRHRAKVRSRTRPSSRHGRRSLGDRGSVSAD